MLHTFAPLAGDHGRGRKEDGIATIILNRLESLNAISVPLSRDLMEAVDHVSKDDEVRAVVLLGAGRALEFIILADFWGAEDAYNIGIMNRVLPADKLESETTAMARGLANGHP